ncbi:hypothetical protein R3I93_005446 [Phoxinus phoxinus]|uniref:Uncharacterized protein n=1 Tax=Phoxinus phoxinus TaxID=58324 RepID=A0AAN9HCT6_9TELE
MPTSAHSRTIGRKKHNNEEEEKLAVPQTIHTRGRDWSPEQLLLEGKITSINHSATHHKRCVFRLTCQAKDMADSSMQLQVVKTLNHPISLEKISTMSPNVQICQDTVVYNHMLSCLEYERM